MLPTITDQIRTSILGDYLTYALTAFLVYKPDLGFDDSPTETQHATRRSVTMQDIVEYEVGGYSLNGYARQYIEQPTIKVIKGLATLTAVAEFQAIGGPVGPFTHLCLARGSNIFNLSPSNGNNRGDYQGQLILTMPVSARVLSDGTRGLILDPPEKYKVTIPINLSNYLI